MFFGLKKQEYPERTCKPCRKTKGRDSKTLPKDISITMQLHINIIIWIFTSKLCLYLYEKIPHPQTGSPGHTALVHWFQILQGREGWSGSELLNRSLSWRDHKILGSPLDLQHKVVKTGLLQSMNQCDDVGFLPLAPLSTKPNPSLSFFCRSTVFSLIM